MKDVCFTVKSSLIEQFTQCSAASQDENKCQVNGQVISTPSSTLHKTPSESLITATTHHPSTLVTPTSSRSIQIDGKGELTNIHQSYLNNYKLFLAYQTLLQKLIIIQQQNVQILTLLEQNNSTNIGNDTEVPDFPVPIPLQSHEELRIIETYLSTNENNVVCY